MTPNILSFEIPGNEALFTSPHRLQCYEWGDPSALHTVICAHGLTRNGGDFDFLAEALSADFCVLCPDMPGRGGSDWLANPLGYNYPAYVADMHYMLAALRLARVHWVGTSMGGIIGMMLANSFPGCLQSLVLNDIGCLVSAAGLKRILNYAGVKMQFASRAEAEAVLRDICKPFGIHEERHWQHLFACSLRENADGSVRFAYDPAIAASLVTQEAITDINVWGLWPALTKTPVLLIRGEESDILSRETALMMQAGHPQLTLYEVEGAGHAPALMDERQIDTIKSWLNTLVIPA